jgi:hypothetical protein
MEGMMRALVVGIGLAVAITLTPFLPVMGSGGAAMAFGAKNAKTYDAQGNALTRHQSSLKKELARARTRGKPS